MVEIAAVHLSRKKGPPFGLIAKTSPLTKYQIPMCLGAQLVLNKLQRVDTTTRGARYFKMQHDSNLEDILETGMNPEDFWSQKAIPFANIRENSWWSMATHKFCQMVPHHNRSRTTFLNGKFNVEFMLKIERIVYRVTL